MKRIAPILLSLSLLTSSLTFAQSLGEAIAQGLGSLTLSDRQVAEYSRQAVAQMDAQNPVAGPNDPYTQRLNRIVARHRVIDGIPINYKVYMVKDVNAFATADGSVRVMKGLMDIMTDQELLAVMGHEIGHVINKDSRDAMKRALQRSAVRNAIASRNNALGRLSRGTLGSFADAYFGASFSRQQETEADDYAYSFLKRNGYSVLPLASSFEKLAKQGGASGPEFLSSHPNSANRAKRVRDRARREGVR